MTTVQLAITRDSVVVRLPASGFSMTFPNEISVRDRQIVGIGGVGERAATEAPDSGIVTTPSFDAVAFDPDLAAASTRWAISYAFSGSGISWRHRFARPRLEIVWPAWGSTPRDRRLRYLAACASLPMEINGRLAIRPRVDVPLLRGLFGTRFDPGP